MKHTRRTALTVGIMLAAGSICLAAAAAAPAASAAPVKTEPGSPAILVSADGVHYSTTLDAELFDGLGLLIPGGTEAATLWVQNPTSAPVAVRLSAVDVAVSSPDFAASVSMVTANSLDPDSQSRMLATLADCDVLIDSKLLAAGEAIAMTVSFTMADVGGLVAQADTADLNLLVGMRDGAAGPFPASGCDDDGILIGTNPDGSVTQTTSGAAAPVTSGALAHTGLDGAAPLLVVGGLVVGGLFFLLLGRRRSRASDRE